MKFGLYMGWEEQILSIPGVLILGVELKGGGSGDGDPLGACSSLPQHPQPQPRVCFLMSVIIKYFYRAQKSQNSAKHLTVMHPW